MKKTLGLVTAVVVASSLQVDAQVYGDRTTFMNAISGMPYALNDFNNLNSSLPGGSATIPAPSAVLTYGGAGMTYQIYSPDNSDVWGATDGSVGTYAYVSSLLSGDRLSLNITSPLLATAIGGDFFLSDINENPVPGSLIVTLSNGQVVDVGVDVSGPFMGYKAPANTWITGFTISGSQNPDYYPSMDNLVIATVPEPAVIFTNALVVLGAVTGGWIYRRRQQK